MGFNLFSKQKKPGFTDYVKKAPINMNEVPIPHESKNGKKPLSSISQGQTRIDSLSGSNRQNDFSAPQSIPPVGHTVVKQEIKQEIPKKLPSLKVPKTSLRKETLIESKPRSIRMGPLYIQLSKYEKILSTFSYLDNKTSTLSLKTKNITDLKEQYDESLINWINNIEDLQRKIVYIDKTIFERW